MARWVCGDRPACILDPALGEGVFVDAVQRALGDVGGVRVDAFDIDGDMVDAFMARPRKIQTRCRAADFITTNVRKRYDAIIANPPYVRHHEMDYGEDVLGRFDELCGRRLSRMTNLYGLFLVKIWSLLGPGGRAAVILPAEWLNADFGGPLKAWLLEENAIEAILHFDHADLVFADALTTAAIVLLRRGRAGNAPVTFATVGSGCSLDQVDLDAAPRRHREGLDADRKWTPLFDGAAEEAASFVLRDIAHCTRGIATGANAFFTLRESDRLRLGIDRRDVSLCITKAADAPDAVLTNDHMARLIEADRRVFLLSPRKQLSPAVERYLADGRRDGIDRRYLPSHRPVWFRPERREPASILAMVFARGEFRFVLNEARVLNLTAFHGIYPHDAAPARIAALHAYLGSPEAQAALRGHRRIYGGGLLKLEPRDVEAIAIPERLLR